MNDNVRSANNYCKINPCVLILKGCGGWPSKVDGHLANK